MTGLPQITGFTTDAAKQATPIKAAPKTEVPAIQLSEILKKSYPSSPLSSPLSSPRTSKKSPGKSRRRLVEIQAPSNKKSMSDFFDEMNLKHYKDKPASTNSSSRRPSPRDIITDGVELPGIGTASSRGETTSQTASTSASLTTSQNPSFS